MKYKNSSLYWKLWAPLLLLIVMVSGCEKKENTTLFTAVDTKISGLNFTNTIIENDTINIMDREFIYNGGGVALGDVNGDGFDDVFLAGNQVENKLFLNKGDLRFEDISSKANITKPDTLQWSSGVSLVDVNADGRLDIYVCNTFRRKTEQRKNLLYINQGNEPDGTPIFKEMGDAYGIADTTYSSNAQFFDYDNDGDLDLFIAVNRIEGINPSEFNPLEDDGASPSRDRLYENVWNDSLQIRKYVDVSAKAGIRYHGYSHSSLINDFNDDGWMDIYVANDFLSNDLIYINNQDGTFTNRAGEMFKHFSLSSMGSDIADIDNNGEMDIFTTEMQPYYNKRKKLFQGPSSYQKEIFTKKYGYQYQYTRNTLQLNMGDNPENDLPIFSETGMFANLQETDWSWAPLFGDYDNDGWQDLLITNGFPKDVTDRDFGDFRATASRLVSKERLIEAIPVIKIPNFIFKNNGNLDFQDVTKEWGLDFGTFSNGAAYGDLDHDGDLDLVINNINDQVLLLENNSTALNPDNHYVRVKLVGPKENVAAIGSVVSLYSKGKRQQKSLLSGRGYLSQPEKVLHFGLGYIDAVDSITIKWPNGMLQKVSEVPVDSLFKIDYSMAKLKAHTRIAGARTALFEEVASKYRLPHLDKDHDFIDFNFQSTIPHKFSQFGPSLAVGDVNGDGLEDLFVSGSRSFKETWFLQNNDGTFEQKKVAYKAGDKMEEEDAGTLLFDADNDGDQDLYIVRGSGQYPVNHEFYRDVLMINDGKGNFSENKNALPNITANGSSVKAADFDQDGDLDLFVGSRVLPGSYPTSDRSYILLNESEKSIVRFVDGTKDICSDLRYPGMISDALWTDFNNDTWPDLILAGEWMPVRFFQNNQGKLEELKDTGIADYSGWWNSLASGDIDNDGDVDYFAGNYGKNIYFQGSSGEPVRLYAKDLDQNGTIDPLISYYLRDSLGTRKEYLYHPWQDVTNQYVGIRKKFNSFGEFGEATLPEMFADGLLDDASKFSANYFSSSWIENLGNGKFAMHELPLETQLAPVFGVLPQYLDDDNLLDVLLIGNDFGMEVQQGKADALNGLVLVNQGEPGTFKPILQNISHFFVPGNGKSLISMTLSNDQGLIIASQNNDSLKVFEPKSSQMLLSIGLRSDEVRVKTIYDDGTENVQEFYWGSTFQSQSGRTFIVPPRAKELHFADNFGKETRRLEL